VKVEPLIEQVAQPVIPPVADAEQDTQDPVVLL